MEKPNNTYVYMCSCIISEHGWKGRLLLNPLNIFAPPKQSIRWIRHVVIRIAVITKSVKLSVLQCDPPIKLYCRSNAELYTYIDQWKGLIGLEIDHFKIQIDCSKDNRTLSRPGRKRYSFWKIGDHRTPIGLPSWKN